MQNQYYTIYDASQKTGVPRSTIKEWIAKGHIRLRRILINGHPTAKFFTEKDLFLIRLLRGERQVGIPLERAAHAVNQFGDRFYNNNFCDDLAYLDYFRETRDQYYYTIPFAAWMVGMEKEKLHDWVSNNYISVADIYINGRKNGRKSRKYFTDDNINSARLLFRLVSHGASMREALKINDIVYGN